MNPSILITGATGVLGKSIVEAALKAGFTVRQGVRDLKKATPKAEAVSLNYSDPATIAPAMAGVTGLVLMAPSLDANAPAELAPVIGAAKTTGVRHIVFISAFGVNYNEQAPLRVVEHLVMNSGVPYTILRPNFFMENFSEGFLSGSIKAQAAIFLAAGDGKTSFISVQDIAAAVVGALQAPLAGKEFDLTGPEALDHAEVARIIGEAAGRPVAYYSLTEEQMLSGARAQGMPEPAIAYLAVLYSVVRQGLAAGVTGDVEAITGRKPMTFAEFARTSAGAWRTATA
ncbi:MAG TPA: SDR family oxidoreductase [Paludibaculum sp.]|jgi:uncharacterized protein YbjT (DUF2867 family)